MRITLRLQNINGTQEIRHIEEGFSNLLKRLEEEKGNIADVKIVNLSCSGSTKDFCWDQANLENHDIHTLLDLYNYLRSENHKWIDLF